MVRKLNRLECNDVTSTENNRLYNTQYKGTTLTTWLVDHGILEHTSRHLLPTITPSADPIDKAPKTIGQEGCDLKLLLAGQLSIPPCQQDLQGWMSEPRSDAATLASLKLPRDNLLLLVVPDHLADKVFPTEE
uniref:Uncharacterized protein n=1 Tax=Timema shepardi TaxID=629360 RepID=A0A7R9G771_TIMSH|nr:unnamed protein product [Timema shepardi]